MAVAQKPLAAAIFGEAVPGAAWRTIPSWYLVAQDDQALSPDLERFYVRAWAHTTEIRSRHVPFISHPQEVARVIEEAAAVPPL